MMEKQLQKNSIHNNNQIYGEINDEVSKSIDTTINDSGLQKKNKKFNKKQVIDINDFFTNYDKKNKNDNSFLNKISKLNLGPSKETDDNKKLDILSKITIKCDFLKTTLNKIILLHDINELKSESQLLVSHIIMKLDYRQNHDCEIVSVFSSFLKNYGFENVQTFILILIQDLFKKFLNEVSYEFYMPQFIPFIFDFFSHSNNDKFDLLNDVSTLSLSFFTDYALGTVVVDVILKYLESKNKWIHKLSALKFFDKIILKVSPKILQYKIIDSIKILSDISTDFKPELAKQGLKTLVLIVKVLDNLDLQDIYENIVDAIIDPLKVPLCIKLLSSITFVVEITEPVLFLLVMILKKSLTTFSSNNQLRQTVIIIKNLVQFVSNKSIFIHLFSLLIPGVENIVSNASLPEVRDLASISLKSLKEIDEYKSETSKLFFINKNQSLSFYTYKIDDYLRSELEKFLMNSDYKKDHFSIILLLSIKLEDWHFIKKYLISILNQIDLLSMDDRLIYAETVINNIKEFYSLDNNKNIGNNDDVIVDTCFSLAYGSKFLLDKTNLRLLNGHIYGICGKNGTGKSTLIRSIANGHLENFPFSENLKISFVESNFETQLSNQDIISYITSDKELENISNNEIMNKLSSFGFTKEILNSLTDVNSLSGGWKMKLELVKSFLKNSKILLLDEPTNHLDLENVKWLEDYLTKNKFLTTLIISHDTSFLNNVCTDIIHYENKKLVYYEGNLNNLLEKKPEIKSYFTLDASCYEMMFPSVGLLNGIKSSSRSIININNVSFSYPNSKKKSLNNVTASLSLSSRVALSGPNGAGKTTLVKLIINEIIPSDGKIEKHPNLRLGYVAQNALSLVKQHYEKTAKDYLFWRYKFNFDRELLVKESLKLSEDEEKLINQLLVIDDGRGERYYESIVGRQKLKKTFQYEIKWKNWPIKYNTWVSKEWLFSKGFGKLVERFDNSLASQEGLGYRELIVADVTNHFILYGLDSEVINHTAIGSLSGGQLVKVIVAGAMWNNPHFLIMDEPTNYLDRDSMGALVKAIQVWNGGLLIISHNTEFITNIYREKWIFKDGEIVSREKNYNYVDSASLSDLNQFKSSLDTNTDLSQIKKKVKKKTRNEKKAQVERRKLRHLEWLSAPKGTPRPIDTDDDE